MLMKKPGPSITIMLNPTTIKIQTQDGIETHAKSLKRFLIENADDPLFVEFYEQHIHAGRKSRQKPDRKPKHYPYWVSFNRSTWTHTIRRYDGKKTYQARFFYPEPSTDDTNPPVEDILKYNMDYAKIRELSHINRYEREKSKTAHAKLIKLLGVDYESFPLRPTEPKHHYTL